MRILAIDPGLQCCGFGVVDADGGTPRYVASGTIRTGGPAQPLALRLRTLFDGVTELIRQHAPTQAAIELVFVNANPQATLLLGQARGACLVALAAAGLPVAEYTALQMKKAVAGYGKAGKDEVRAMVQRLLDLPGLPGADAADALGLAITHVHAARSLAQLGLTDAGAGGVRYRGGRRAGAV